MFRDDVDSAQGQQLVEEGFPAGANAPTDVVVTDASKFDDVRSRAGRAPGVSRSAAPSAGPTGIKLEATLEEDPFSTAGFDLVPGIRYAVHGVAGEDVLVGGPSAEERDLRESAARDNRVIVPIALLVVFLILAALLRAVVAPLVLIGTVILSYARRAGDRDVLLRERVRLPGHRSHPAAVRVHLPGGAGHRLQHLLDGARARGDDHTWHAQRDDSRPGGDRER